MIQACRRQRAFQKRIEEKSKGSLAPGKLADFVVLSDDIMRIPAAQILKTRVTMTVVGGEVVHSQ